MNCCEDKNEKGCCNDLKEKSFFGDVKKIFVSKIKKIERRK